MHSVLGQRPGNCAAAQRQSASDTLQEARQQIQVQPSVSSCTNVLSVIISLSGGAQRSQGQCTMVGELARDSRYAVQRVTHGTLLRGSL